MKNLLSTTRFWFCRMLKLVPTETVWSIIVDHQEFGGISSAWSSLIENLQWGGPLCLRGEDFSCSCWSSVTVWVCLYVRGGQHPVYCSSAASVMIVRGNGDSSQCVISLSLGWTSNNRFLQEERDPLLCVCVCLLCVAGGWVRHLVC